MCYVSFFCLMHRLFSVLGVPYFYIRVPSDFCLQNLNHPFYTLREQFLSNRNHAHLALFACFNINQNDKTFTFHSLGCFIIFYFSGNVCIYMLDLLEVCARPYSIKTLNINWYHKSHLRARMRKFQFLLNAWNTFSCSKNEKKTCKFMLNTWHGESKSFVWYLMNSLIADID